jgi:hypothetical protein
MRHAGLLVEINDGGLRIRSELGGGGAQCIRSLQGMPALHAALAFSAAADVNVELPLNGPTGYLDLILVVDVRFVDLAAAVRASDRQQRLVGFVDLLRWQAMSFGAVVFAGLAARLLRLGHGWPLGERGSLTFAGAALFVEQARQVFDLSAKLGDFAFEADTVKAWCFTHTFTVAAARFVSCATLPREFAGAEEPVAGR